MKKLTILIFILLNIGLFAQKDHTNNHRSFSKRFEELEKIKLLENLNLDEDTAIIFFARRNKLKNSIEKIMDERKAIYNELEKFVDKKDIENNFTSLINKINANETKLVNMKTEFIKSLKNIFSEEQIAKYIIFERNFRRDVRSLLIEKGRKKYNKDRSE